MTPARHLQGANIPPVGKMTGVHQAREAPSAVLVLTWPHSCLAVIVGVADMLLLSIRVYSGYSRRPHCRGRWSRAAGRGVACRYVRIRGVP